MNFEESKTVYNYFGNIEDVLKDGSIEKYEVKFDKISIIVDIYKSKPEICEESKKKLTCFLNSYLYTFVYNNVKKHENYSNKTKTIPSWMDIHANLEPIKTQIFTKCDVILVKLNEINLDFNMVKALKYYKKNFHCNGLNIYDILLKEEYSNRFNPGLPNQYYSIDASTRFIFSNLFDDQRFFMPEIDTICLKFYIESFFALKNRENCEEYHIPKACIVIAHEYFYAKEFFTRLVRIMKVCNLFYLEDKQILANEEEFNSNQFLNIDLFHRSETLMIIDLCFKKQESYFLKNFHHKIYNKHNIFCTFIVNTHEEAESLVLKLSSGFLKSPNSLKIYESDRNVILTPYRYLKKFEKTNSQLKRDLKDKFYIYLQRFLVPMRLINKIFKRAIDQAKLRSSVGNNGFDEDDFHESCEAHSIFLKSFIENELQK